MDEWDQNSNEIFKILVGTEIWSCQIVLTIFRPNPNEFHFLNLIKFEQESSEISWISVDPEILSLSEFFFSAVDDTYLDATQIIHTYP